MAVIEKLTITQTTTPPPAQTAIITLLESTGNQDFPTIVTAQRMDLRGPANPICHLTQPAVGAGGVAGGIIYEVQLPAVATGTAPVDVILDDNQEIPLLPGVTLTVFAAALNAEISASIFWRERFLEESERS